MNFWSQSGRDTWLTMSLTWHASHGAARTRKANPTEWSSLRNGRPILYLSTHQPTAYARPVYVCFARDIKQAPLSDHHRKTWCSLAEQGRSKLIKPWSAQQLTKAKELAEHVCYMTTAGKRCPVRQQLARIKGTWQGHAAAITAALQLSGDVTMFLESWFEHSNVQTTNQMVTRVSSQIPALNTKKNGSKSRQMNTFPSYKY